MTDPKSGTTTQSNAVQGLDFMGDPIKIRALIHALRLRHGITENPEFAAETALIDPLPHQHIAVYEHMLQQDPLRFLLADDAGAGKTIMTGLYIRTQLMRYRLRRILIVPPAGLVGNWQRELEHLFQFHFCIVEGSSTRQGNPFVGPNAQSHKFFGYGPAGPEGRPPSPPSTGARPGGCRPGHSGPPGSAGPPPRPRNRGPARDVAGR